MKKIAFIFPGMGYHKDKPILYYASRLAKKHGFHVKSLTYAKMPEGRDHEDLSKAYEIALNAAQKEILSWDFSSYEEVLFISKSVGTAAAATCTAELLQKKVKLQIMNWYFTPVSQSLPMLCGKGIVFSGLKDPWVKQGEVKEWCQKMKYPLYQFEGANHSLETGDVMEDLDIMNTCMKHCEESLFSN